MLSIDPAFRDNPKTVHTGIAAEDLKDNSIVLAVILPELFPNTAYGTLAPGITQIESKLQDRDGNAIQSSITSANHMVATWGGESNLRYPPFVQAGEAVDVWMVAGSDKVYWTSTGRGRALRKTDRVHVEVAAIDPNGSPQDKSDSNTYSMYLDSTNKKVGLKTSKVNGEACAISAEIDLAGGTFHFSDDAADPGNRLFIDTGAKSGVPAIQLNVSTGAVIKIQGKDIFVKAPGKFCVDAEDRIILNAPIIALNLNKVGSILLNAANLAISTAKDFVVSAGGVIGLNAVSTKVAGFFGADTARIANATKGPLAGSYKGISAGRLEDGPVTPVTNSADTTPAPLPYSTM